MASGEELMSEETVSSDLVSSTIEMMLLVLDLNSSVGNGHTLSDWLLSKWSPVI